MRRFCLLTILMSLSLGLFSQTVWKVQTVPNTRLESNEIHVSDPDGYLSYDAEQTINASLSSIRNEADVFVVTLGSIGNANTKRFATELFNYWGIGDAETNNGVLLLFVEDQRTLEFETGYGAEQTLTDTRCQSIFTHSIVPHFKAGDYEAGLLAGVNDIVEVFNGNYQEPTQLMSRSGSEEDGPAVTWLFVLVLLIVIGLIVYAMVSGGGSSSGGSSSSSGSWSSSSRSSSRSSYSSGGSFGGGHSGGGGYSGRW